MSDHGAAVKAFTLFCDDVRQEQGGKLSAMGIYQGVMAIPADEVLLPKLVAWLMLVQPYSEMADKARVQLWDGEQLLSDAEITFANPPWDAQGAAVPNMGQTTVNIPFEMVPFKARAGMALRLVYTTDNYNYESDALHIIKAV